MTFSKPTKKIYLNGETANVEVRGAMNKKENKKCQASQHPLDRVVSVPKGDKWHRIETAPKDGTVIDVWHCDYGLIKDCWFDDDHFVGCPEGYISYWREIPRWRIKQMFKLAEAN